MDKFDKDSAKQFLKDCDAKISQMCAISRDLTNESLYSMISQSIMYSHIICCTAKFHFFGSRVIGVATRESDLDIFVDNFRRFHCSYSTYAKDKTIFDGELTRIASCLEENPSWKVERLVMETAVPIIKAVYLPLNIRCKLRISRCAFIFIESLEYLHR